MKHPWNSGYYYMTVLLAVALLPSLVYASSKEDRRAIEDCLENWDHHSFPGERPKFKTLSGKVKVLGIGGGIEDTRPTDQPELILIKPAVNVLSKMDMKLMNPNGWYCLKGKVSVLGKIEVTLHCNAHLTSSQEGANVLGGSDRKDGVTVLGTSRFRRVGCKSH